LKIIKFNNLERIILCIYLQTKYPEPQFDVYFSSTPQEL